MNTEPPILVAVADDHHLVLDSLSEVINRFSGFKVIIKASNGKDLVDMIATTTAKPDICVLDVNMPVMNGYDTVSTIKKQWPSIKILAISMYDDDFAVISMLQKGADGYITKGDTLQEVKKALSSIHKYGYYYSRLVSKELFSKIKTTTLPKLTDREKEYLALCCTDITVHEIATKMGISARSVEYYRDTLYAKLHVQTRAGLIKFVMETGIISINK